MKSISTEQLKYANNINLRHKNNYMSPELQVNLYAMDLMWNIKTISTQMVVETG